MKKQNGIHRDGYNLTTKSCSISKGSIDWRKSYAQMEKYLADMILANISRGIRCRKVARQVLKVGVPYKGCVYQPNLKFFQYILTRLFAKGRSFSNSFWKTTLHSPEVVFRSLTV